MSVIFMPTESMRDKQLRDYRDRMYDRYVSSRGGVLAPRDVSGFEPRRAYLTQLIRKHFPSDRDSTILDLGCGHGTMVYFSRLAGYRNTVGVDTSPEQVDEAKRLGIDGVDSGGVME